MSLKWLVCHLAIFLVDCLEYSCAVWTSYTAHDIDLLESVQNRAAHWIKSYWDPSALKWSKSSTICIKELKWPLLKVRWQYIYCILTLYSILNGTAANSFTKYLQFNKFTTWMHSLTLNIASSINVFRHSFLLLLHFYGIPCHMKSYPSQLHKLLKINLSTFFFVLR